MWKIGSCLLLIFGIHAKTIEFPSAKIEKIDIVIETQEPAKYDTAQLLTTLLTQVGHCFYQEDFDSDLKMLAKQFDGVRPSIHQEADKLTVQLVLTPKPLISQLIFSGNRQVKTSKLKKVLGIHPPTPFSQAEIAQRVAALQQDYIKKGYFEAQVQSKLEPLENEKAILKLEIQEGKWGKIHQVQLHGVDEQVGKQLFKKIYTKPSFFLTSWLTRTNVYCEELVHLDKLIIVNDLQSQGYANASLETELISLSNQALDLHFTIDCGQKYQFDEISFEGNRFLSDEQVKDAIGFTKKESYSLEKVLNGQRFIKDLYGQHGYIETEVTYTTHLNPENKSYRVHYKIAPSAQYRAGLFHIIGNSKTDQRVILHESSLLPGDILDLAKLQATRERLLRTGYFDKVTIYPAKPSETQTALDSRDIYIEVEEAKTGKFSLSGGYSAEDGLCLLLEAADRNFNLSGIYNIFQNSQALRGGGQHLDLSLKITQKDQSYHATWITPHLLDSSWRLKVELLKSNHGCGAISSTPSFLGPSYVQALQIQEEGGAATITYPINSLWSFGAQYTLKTVETFPSKLFKNGPAQEENQWQKDWERIKAKLPKDGLLSSIATELNYDSTNHPTRPTRGLRSSLRGQFTGLAGDFTFVKLSYFNVYYLPVHRHGVLKMRADFGLIYPLESDVQKKALCVPLIERFFMGGIDSVRGYKKNVIGESIVDETWKQIFIGALSSALVSFEYIWHIAAPTLQAFAFIDIGYDSTKSIQEHRFDCLKKSIGIGMRAYVGQLPLMIGLGYPIFENQNELKLEKPWFFSIATQY